MPNTPQVPSVHTLNLSATRCAASRTRLKLAPTPSSAMTIRYCLIRPVRQWQRYVLFFTTRLTKESIAVPGAFTNHQKLLNTPSSTLVFMPNATTGINTVLRNLTFKPTDYILYFATIYGACEKTVAYITETTPAKSVKILYTYPVEDDWLIAEFHRVVQDIETKGAKVKIAIFDTIVSMPGVRMPFERLTQACKETGVLSCIDGAHGVGHIKLDMSELDPDFFVSNCHKYVSSQIYLFLLPPAKIDTDGSTSPAAAQSSTYPRATNTS